ncbi:BBP7 family outer membrane beta-barrel protein [Roseiconus nitratireducens]|nr:BBP7 family outer membrane beta-barrel protein [Roseiconus nitratireducens]
MTQEAFRRSSPRMLLLCGMLAMCHSAAAVEGLVRGKTPDRGSWTPPEIRPGELQPVSVTSLEASSVRQLPAQSDLPAPVNVDDWEDGDWDDSVRPVSHEGLQPVDHRQVDAELQALPIEGIASYQRSEESVTQYPKDHVEGSVQQCSCQSCTASSSRPAPLLGEVAGYGAFDGGFDVGCDASGCDAMGCDGGCTTGRVDCDRWFGTVELLLMWRSGDRLPALVTTTTDADPDAETAGRLDDAGTVVLAGRESVFKDLRAGGRFTLGTWLDAYKDRSLVARGWFAGQESHAFSANQDSSSVLTRPFLNVTDGVTPAQDTQIIAFPDRATGAIQIQGDSDVYGADLSIRQLWAKPFGGTIDLLYGYQYMGMDESLSISSRSISIDDDFAPVGAVIAVRDAFDIENDFHGGQLGVATHYREGCWSFSSLAKIGFGSIQRKATRTGNTLTSIDGNNATNPNGLLVRSTNDGTIDDDTFGWVPELDFTLGWQRYPAFDVTVGYHVIAMTDALQVSGAIDPSLAVNLADPPTGAARPSPQFRYDTFYVQGIHFGLSYIY